MLRLDVYSSRELQAAIIAMRQTDKAILTNIRKYTRGVIVPEFQKSMAQHAHTNLEHRVLVRNARATVSNQNITLRAGKVGKQLSGGLMPSRDAHAVEFGGNREKQTSYSARSRKGKSFQVTRRTQAQLRPRNRKGYVFYPTAAEMIPRIASLWVQTIVRTIAEGLEGKRG